MNDVVGLAECLRLCVNLERQIENDCLIPSDALGGEMRSAYERVRAKQLADLRAIKYRLYDLLDRG